MNRHVVGSRRTTNAPFLGLRIERLSSSLGRFRQSRIVLSQKLDFRGQGLLENWGRVADSMRLFKY